MPPKIIQLKDLVIKSTAEYHGFKIWETQIGFVTRMGTDIMVNDQLSQATKEIDTYWNLKRN